MKIQSAEKENKCKQERKEKNLNKGSKKERKL
jgi:hypothetical protein